MNSHRQCIDLNKLFFKYCVYYPALLLRREWVSNHLRRLEQSQYWPKEKLEAFQLQRLNQLISHARATVPYYRDILPEKLDSIADLAKVPMLEKDVVRSSFEELLSTKSGFLTRNKTTGGSTGAPVTIRKDSRGMAQELAATWRGYHWADVDIGDRQARFWGVPANKSDLKRARLIDFVGNRKRLSAFSFADADLARYVSELEKFRPTYFYGYVSMIKQFAEYVDRSNLQGKLSVKAIITTSEVLNEADRNFISKVFSAPVFNEYGCGEIGTIAHECEQGNMHITSENMLVEIVREDGTLAQSGESGEIVVTDLCNYSMPLIRYKMKDFGSVSTELCKCRRGLHVLSSVHGREYDVLMNTTGQKFHGEFFLYMVEDLKKKGTRLNGYQVVQSADKSLTLNIACDPEDFSSVCDYLKQEIANKFDSTVRLSFNRVSHIERESSGKLRVVKRLQ